MGKRQEQGHERVVYLGGRTAGVIGLLTLLGRGIFPDVVCYSADVAELSDYHDLTTLRFIDLERLAPYDLLVSVHCRNIIPRSFLDSLPLGGINVHPMLSTHKGADPIGRALAEGFKRFSVGVHKMTARVDEGPVLVERSIEGLVPDPKRGYLTREEVYGHLYPLYSIVLDEALNVLIGHHPGEK
jgi:hypothetical protein